MLLAVTRCENKQSVKKLLIFLNLFGFLRNNLICTQEMKIIMGAVLGQLKM
jgi:hypothetical protein